MKQYPPTSPLPQTLLLVAGVLLSACGGGSSDSDSDSDSKSDPSGLPSGQVAASAASDAASSPSAKAASDSDIADTAAEAGEPALGASDSAAASAASNPRQLARPALGTAARGTTGTQSGSGAATPALQKTTPSTEGSGWSGPAIGISQEAAPGSTRRTVQAAGTVAGTTSATTPLATTSTTSNTTYAPVYSGQAYYVNGTSGHDGNAGTSSDKPWRSLSRAAQAVLNSGDALLLHCGSAWHEAASFTKAFAPKGQVLIGAYGSCANARKPLIKGSTPVPSGLWQLVSSTASGSIYSVQITVPVAGVFLNGTPLLRARHPNFVSISSNFATSTSNTTGNRLVVSADDKALLNGRDMLGATVVMRSAPYMIESGEASAYDSGSGTVTLKAAPKSVLSGGAGYFVEGKRWMLDAANEWLHEPASNTLLVFMPTGSSPSGNALEFTQPRNTLTITGIAGLRLENIAVLNAGEDGVQIKDSPAARLSGLEVHHARSHGINVLAPSWSAIGQGVTIENSFVNNAGITGIGSAVIDTLIAGNTVINTGVAGIGGLRPVAGIRLSQVKNSTVNGNSIKHSGYSAILFGNQENTSIRDNRIENSCLVISDCGAIYSWGSNATAIRASIAGNHILRTSTPNLNGINGGSSGGAPNLLAAIYLDEGSNNIDVTSNFIDDAYVGINLHKAKNNVVNRNYIYGVREAGLRIQSSGIDSQSVIGNRIEDNVIYAPGYFIKGTDGNPVPVGATPQLWIHQSNASSMFSGTSKNTIARNTSVHLGDDSALRWVLRSGATNQTYNSKTWLAIAPSDSNRSPFQANVVTVQGAQLLGNSTMESSESPWTSYAYTAGAQIVQFGTTAACSGSCASFVPTTTNDVIMQAGVKPNPTGSDLMFLRYRTHATDASTSSKFEVRSNVSPYPSAGYLETPTELSPNTQLLREAFFSRTTKGDLRVSMKAGVGARLLVDSVELFQVSSFQLHNPLIYGRLLVNRDSQATSISCASLALSNCNVVNESGTALFWPISLAAKSSRMIFIKDTTWMVQ